MPPETTTFWTAATIAQHVKLSRPVVYHHWRRYILWRKEHGLPATFPPCGVIAPHEARELMAFIHTKRRRFSGR